MDDDRLAAEQRARVLIDRQLTAAGWVVQDRKDLNLFAAQGVAVRETTMASGHGRADYLLYVDQQAVGVVEAKPQGTTLSGAEWQSAMYAEGLPAEIRLKALTVAGRLPFMFEASGSEPTPPSVTTPSNAPGASSPSRDPSRSREISATHRPLRIAPPGERRCRHCRRWTLRRLLRAGQATSRTGGFRAVHVLHLRRGDRQGDRRGSHGRAGRVRGRGHRPRGAVGDGSNSRRLSAFRLHRWTMTTSLRRPSLPDQRVHRCQLP